ncbi:MAG TPA: aldo/keto reductase [Tepidisphaeraceae bacterium]|jgi:aryl-alcohol dehydrogenase-like predicted oxidoreductase|nr:aldo/keto reductase [Tepidisphaeraceae bacterium]
MKYRTLGSTGLRVSVIGIGTWQLGGEWAKEFSQGEVDQMFDACRQTGINLIDTAECYGDHLSESLIGRAIERDRDKWIVATKIGHKFHGYMDRTDERTANDAVKQLEDSLKALRTDHVDVLQYHSIRDSEFDNAELQQAMIKLKQQGKVRHIGNSISPNDNIHQTDAARPAQVEVIQVIYNRIDRVPEKRVFDSCIRQNLGVLARVPLASGFLSGKYKPGTKFAEGDVRSSRDDKQIQEKLKEVEQIQKTEVPPGVNMATWALAWCLQHPAVTSVIPGCKNVDQVKTNAAAADLDIVRSDHPQAVK